MRFLGADYKAMKLHIGIVDYIKAGEMSEKRYMNRYKDNQRIDLYL